MVTYEKQSVRSLKGAKLWMGSKFKKLSFKIPFAYFLIILFTVVVSYIVLDKVSTNSAQRKINETSLQTITSIQTNINLMIENVNNYSKMIFSDFNLQGLLRQGDIYSNLQAQGQVSSYIYNLMQAVPIIDSVYVFDNGGHRLSVGTQQLPTFVNADVEETSWYKRAIANEGKYFLQLNGRDDNHKFVSFIRLIRDLDNTSQLGVLVINIKVESFAQAYANLLGEDSFQVAILDENNELIVANASNDKQIHTPIEDVLAENKKRLEAELQQSDSGFFSLNTETQQYTASFLVDENNHWKFISLNPYDFVDTRNKMLVLVMFLLLIVNGTVFFVSSFIISNSIIKPIHKLLRAMNKAPSGNLRKVNVELSSYEFEQLFIGYNDMIQQIDQMVAEMIEEQNTIRRAELGALQAQIKPHFLYNTLDSITSLALSGLNDQVVELLDALGSYYRLSVSKGREVITIGEEIEMVRNYLIIQQVRYRDVFEVEFDIDARCNSVLIPKLVLQPLVENSIYHGIRPKGGKGKIRITVMPMDGKQNGPQEGVLLSISDDGIGMSKPEITQILNTERKGQIQSFGLWGTMERLRIFYKDEGQFLIDSEHNQGTTITIVIPNGVDMSWEN
ncbi:two-component system sensor histidine kinase YesM [Paenibacillus turicensis]|uniref:Two-component system sensor histidine kinase YesM n=1 Tax=Paenibacillus turicensis TaxID=160487 RepID=A0ABS4FPY7_9BACL|nr:two-component system sensor histidine kinase YesM [Paenibacillus turicensis]